MNFAKGALIGMVAGTIVGVMNKDSIMSAFKTGRKQVKKMQRRYGM